MLLIAIIVLAFSASAAEFRLKDGSVVYGSILRLVDGQDLVVDTSHMGEVTLEWDALQRFDETSVLEVELFDGSRFLGSLMLEQGLLKITGEDPREIAPASVFTISEVKFGFWDRVGLYVDLGLNLVRGNSRVTQYNLGAGVTYDAPGVDISLDAVTFLNEQEETENTRRTSVSGQYTRQLLTNSSLIGLLEYEADDQQELDGRLVLGGALGQRLLNNRQQRVELFAGFALNSEDYAQSSADESTEVVLGARYRMRMAADIDATLLHFRNLEDQDRYRNQFDATLTVELASDFDLSMTAYDRFDSAPPGGVGKSDYGIVLGLRWSL